MRGNSGGGEVCAEGTREGARRGEKKSAVRRGEGRRGEERDGG
jgi:hypothetical protein